MKGNKWTWAASTRPGIDSSPKAAKARSQRTTSNKKAAKTSASHLGLAVPRPPYRPPPPPRLPKPVGDGEGAMGFSKNLFHLVFDGRHSCHGMCLMDGVVYFPFEYRTPEDF